MSSTDVLILLFNHLPSTQAMSVTKGVILVGGPSKGTRMRPLSLDCECVEPKSELNRKARSLYSQWQASR
jgi:hypothetical protein